MKKTAALLLALACLLVALPGAWAEDEKEPTYEEMLADSVPLSLEPVEFKEDGIVLKVTPMLMDQRYLTEMFSEGPTSLSVAEGKMTVLFGKEVHRLVLPEQAGEALKHDKAFGQDGVAAYDKKKGWQPAETFEFGDWFKSRPLGDLVGHKADQPHNRVQIKDAAGKDVVSLGTEEGDGSICWVQNFCRYKDLVFIVDSNCRSLDIWTVQGEFVKEIEMRDLGLDYPWPMSIDITDDGVLYLGFTQDRPSKEKEFEPSGISESAFLKITGLDTIKPK